jgi:phosphoribosyl 1,2-cyclic phosphodiesterase
MLIDCGIGPRVTAQRLANSGVRVGDLSAVCLTHLDRDHFSPSWLATLVRQGVRLFCHREKVGAVLRATQVDSLGEVERLIVPFEEGEAFCPLEGVRFEAIGLAHDREGSHGFVIEGFDYRIGYATDLGHVPTHLLERFCDLDLLALESNYDSTMQQASPRPFFLKRRITGGRGHLSNDQALAAVRQILDRAQACDGRLPEHIVLLHRSRQCNCPDLVRALFSKDRRIAPRLTLSDQYRPTPWLRRKSVRAATGEQLLLAF